jgi:hypothetical protein
MVAPAVVVIMAVLAAVAVIKDLVIVSDRYSIYPYRGPITELDGSDDTSS